MSGRVFGGGRWGLAAAFAGLVVVAIAAVALGRAPSPSPPRVARPAEAPRPAGEATAVPGPDPGSIRDVFRFADDRRFAARGGPAPGPVGDEPAPPVSTGLRLVGLVRRAGRLMAALSVDGEVELAGQGDSAAGVTVVSVGEEGVRVRHADGTEEMLVLP